MMSWMSQPRQEAELSSLRDDNGFSLMECLLALLLTSVLAGMAMHTGRDWFQSRHLERAEALLRQAVMITRDLAVRDQQSMCLQPIGLRDDLVILAGNDQMQRRFAWPRALTLTWHSSLGRNAALCYTPWGQANGQRGYFVIEGFGKSRVVHF